MSAPSSPASRSASSGVVALTIHAPLGPAAALSCRVRSAPLRLEPPATLRRQQRAAWAAVGTCTCPRVRARLLGGGTSVRAVPGAAGCAGALPLQAWALGSRFAFHQSCGNVNCVLCSWKKVHCLPAMPCLRAAAAWRPAPSACPAAPLQRSGLPRAASTPIPSGGSATRRSLDCEHQGVALVMLALLACGGTWQLTWLLVRPRRGVMEESTARLEAHSSAAWLPGACRRIIAGIAAYAFKQSVQMEQRHKQVRRTIESRVGPCVESSRLRGQQQWTPIMRAALWRHATPHEERAWLQCLCYRHCLPPRPASAPASLPLLPCAAAALRIHSEPKVVHGEKLPSAVTDLAFGAARHAAAQPHGHGSTSGSSAMCWPRPSPAVQLLPFSGHAAAAVGTMLS